MRRSSAIALGAGALLLGLAVFLYVVNSRPRPRAEDLIRQALTEAERAARARDVGGVMRTVSDDYKDASGMNKDRLRLLLANSVRRSQGVRYDVSYSPPRISFPDERRETAVVMTVISVTDRSGGGVLWGGQPVTLAMKRETRRKWLIFPEDHWRVTSVVNLPPLPGAGGDFGGFLGI